MKPQRWSIQLKPGVFEGPFENPTQALERAHQIRMQQLDNLAKGEPSPYLVATVVPYYDLNDPEELEAYQRDNLSTESHTSSPEEAGGPQTGAPLSELEEQAAKEEIAHLEEQGRDASDVRKAAGL